MRLPSVRSVTLLAGCSFAVLGLGCSTPIVTTEEVLQTRSCLSGARSLVVSASIGGALTGLDWDGGSTNVVGTPSIFVTLGGAEVLAELDSVAAGEEVTLRFVATSVVGPASFTATDIKFYAGPPEDIGTDPGCTPSATPDIALVDQAAIGLGLQVSSTQPLTLVSLELTTAPQALPHAALAWDSAEFNALPWIAVVGANTALDPAAPPLVIDLPDAVPGAGAALCRYVSLAGGHEFRGILQVELTHATVSVRSATWSAVKNWFRR